MEEDIKHAGYIVVRFIELICIAAVIFGALWQGTETFDLTMPQFLMVYGGIGAIVSEFIARVFSTNKKKEVKKETNRG